MGGLESIHPNTHVIERELDENWEVLGEPIQTAMRACELKGLPGMDKPYEKVKELMRGRTINKEQVEQFIDQQSFDPETAARLKALTPPPTPVWPASSSLSAAEIGAMRVSRVPRVPRILRIHHTTALSHKPNRKLNRTRTGVR